MGAARDAAKLALAAMQRADSKARSDREREGRARLSLARPSVGRSRPCWCARARGMERATLRRRRLPPAAAAWALPDAAPSRRICIRQTAICRARGKACQASRPAE